MRSANLIDSLPDAICVVDTSANIKQWNKQFMRKFFGCPSGIFAVGSNIVKGNFVYDVLHPDHRHRFASAINTLRTSHRLDGEIRCVALRFSISYTKGPNVTDRICRLIHWTMSSTDREDIYVLVGRNPDIENVGPDRANDQELNIDISNSAGSGTAAAVEQSSNDPKFSAATCEQTSDSTSKHLEGYFKTAPVPLHLLSCDGKIIWANDSELKLVGYHADEYIGHEMTEFLCPGEDKILLEVLEKLRNHETVHDVSLRFLKRNGEAHRMLVDSNASFGNDGSFAHARCFIRPDKHFEIKENVLRDKNKLSRKHAESRTTFIRNVFHEIRTPMHALYNFFCDSNPTREDFEDMKHHTESILGIVDDLSFSTAFEAGEDTLMSPVKLHLPTVLAEVVDSVNAVEQKAGGNVSIKLHCEDISGDVEEIVADPYFKRVLFSLLSNAVKFSPIDGVVDVSVVHSIRMRESTRNMADMGHSPGTLTPRRMNLKSQEPFVSSLSTILESAAEASNREDVDSKNGYFTFHFRNNTVTPMNVAEVSNYFKSYYHSKSTGYISSSGSIAGSTSYSSLIERPSGDRREGSLMSRCSSPPSFKDLQVYSGLGLGLYTAYNMVTLMGGSLECAVENENEASFWFTIPSSISTCDAIPKGVKIQGISGRSVGEGSVPLSAPIAKRGIIEQTPNLFLTSCPPPPPTSFASLSASSYPLVQSPSPPDTGFCRPSLPSAKSFTEYSEQRILVVDDSRICQKVAGRTLSGLEFTLDYASNGLEACNKLSEKPLRYDAVIMDLRMPVMDGLTAIRRCRAELGLTKLPIVALTAEVGASIKDEAMKAGANWFLTKPAKALELVSVMRALSFIRL